MIFCSIEHGNRSYAFRETKKMKLFIVLCVLIHITSFNCIFADSVENDESEKNSPIHEAVNDDNFVNVKKLLNKGADKNAKNYFGRTPLHLAAKRGFENIIKLLIENHAEIDLRDNYGKSPLHFAAQNGHFDIFKLLIQEYENKNIDYINATDIMGMSLLHYAAMNRKPRNTEMLEFLLQKGAEVNAIASDNTTPLDYAASTGNMEMVRLLLDAGAAVNVNFKDSNGDTAIMYAAYGTGGDRQRVFQILIKNNADVNTVNDLGETPLFFVARFGGDDDKLAEFLIKKGAHVNHSNNKGETPLHHAAKLGHKKLGECFIKNNVNKDATNEENQTPLHYAVKYGQIEFAEMLINNGAKVDVADENRNTPLHLAVGEALGHEKILELLSKGEFDVNNFKRDGKSLLHISIEKGGDMKTFKWLLNKGANIHVIDNDGWSLLHSAAGYGRVDIVEWLIKHHPIDQIINKQDNYGNSPLHFAVKGGYYDLTKILLSNGADVNAMNHEFDFPIHVAAHRGHEDILKLLIEYDATVNVRNRIDWTPLFFSVLNGNERVVKILINHKDEDFSLNDMDAQGKTVFHICAEKGSVSVAKILASHGANVSAVDQLGHTPLHRAAAFGNTDFVEWLISAQSSGDNKIEDVINVVGKDGKTPLHLAAAAGYESVVKSLLARNANINIEDKSLDTPLSLAIQNGHRNTAKVLLKHSNDPNMKYAGKRDLILLATERGYDDIVEMLISKNAQVDAEDENKWTPLHIAAKNGHLNIARMLLSHGAKINAKANNNQTAVALAIQNGNYDVVEELLKNNADTNIPDENERTLLDIATQQNDYKTIDLLTKSDKQKKEQARIFHIFILVIFLLIIPLICFIALFFHKLFQKEASESEAGLKLSDLLERYMFPQSKVMLSSRIGKSVYGTVYKGYAHKILSHENETLVAIKVVKGTVEDAASLYEAQKLLQSLGSELKVLLLCGGHLNLVNLLGIVTENIANHELMVIVEYCRFGNLKDVLEKHHKNVKNQTTDNTNCQMQMTKTRNTAFASARSVSRNDLASWSYQIAQGMQFLAAHNIVHGNLAARSILLTDGNIVKISDFGLARAMYKTEAYIFEKEGKLEYKWLAIESMQNRVLTSKSDVWMFGVLLYELFSFGETPYRDIEVFQVKRHVLSGRILEKPPYANENVYEIMQHCFRPNPEARPTFDSLEKWLYQLL